MQNRKLIISAVIAVSAILDTGAASAADLAARTYTKAPPMVDPAYNWSGFYIGANVGYGEGRDGAARTAFSDPSGGIGLAASISGGVFPVNSSRTAGAIGGGQVGYNWQNGRFVYGFEADFSGSGIRGFTTSAFPGGAGFAPSATTMGQKLDWLGTVRGRLGLAANNWLFYGTGGFAYGKVRDSYVVGYGFGGPPFPFGFNGSASSVQTGWVAGAGIEYGISSNWIVRAEYLHADLGSQTYVAGNVNGAVGSQTFAQRSRTDIGRLGLDYKF